MIVDGKIVRNIMRSFKLAELSGVTRPAQTPALAVAIKNAPENTMDPLEIAKAENASLKAQLLRVSKESLLTDAQKAFYATLGEVQKAEWLDKSHAQREIALAEIKKADEVVYTTAAGVEIRKSDGKLAESMARQIDDMTKASAVQSLALEKAAYVAKAEEILGNLPKTVDEKSELVRVVTKFVTDDKVRTAIFEMLKAANDSFEKEQAEKGTVNGGTATGDPYEELVAKTMAEHKCDRYAAITKLQGTPELTKVYNQVASSKPQN